MQHHKKEIKKIEGGFWKFVMKNLISIGIGLLVFYIVLKGIGIHEIRLAIKSIPGIYFVIVFLLYGVIYSLHILKWKTIIHTVKDVDFIQLVPIYFAGGMFNQLTPGATCGGQPYRAYHLSKINKKSFAQNLSTSIFEFCTNAVFHSIVLLSSLVYLISIKVPSHMIALLVISVVLVIAFLLFIALGFVKIDVKIKFANKIFPHLYHVHIFNKLKKNFKNYNTMKSFFVGEVKIFYREMDHYLKNTRLLIKAFLYDILIWTVYALQLMILFLAVDVNIGFIPVIIVLSVSQLANFIMFTPGGVGIVEAVMIGTFGLFGIPLAISAVVPTINRLFLYIYEFVFGYLSFLYLRNIKR